MFTKFPQLSWNLDLLLTEEICEGYSYSIPRLLRKANYSISTLRFWFIYHFLQAEHANRQSLDIAVLQHWHLGKTLKFLNHAEKKGYPPVNYRLWHCLEAVDGGRSFEPALGSQAVLPSQSTSGEYDVLIVYAELTKLEELEALVGNLKQHLHANGIVIGVLDSCCPHKPRMLKPVGLRKKRRPALFISGFLRDIAKNTGYSVDFLSGAYYGRKHGLVPKADNFLFRCHLFMGSLLPGKAGEIYWVFRK